MDQQKMRPQHTAFNRPKQVIAEILQEHIDDPAGTISGRVTDAIFTELGIEQLRIEKRSDGVGYHSLQSAEEQRQYDEYIRYAMAHELGRFVAEQGGAEETLVPNHWERSRTHRMTCWVLRTPRGRQDG